MRRVRSRSAVHAHPRKEIMRLPALLKTGRRQAVELGAPPAVWQAFQRAGAWKNWTIVVLLGLCVLQTLVAVQLVSRPAEYVLVGSDGKATYVRRGVATDALLRFLADKTKPPELTVVRFTRDFLVLSLGINSATVESNWPAALALMGPDLRGRVEKEAKELGMVGAYKTSGQKTDLQFEDVAIVTQTSNLIHVRATLTRTRRSLLDDGAVPAIDRIAVDLAERLVPARLDRPDGLEVVEWRIEKLSASAAAATGPNAKVELSS